MSSRTRSLLLLSATLALPLRTEPAAAQNVGLPAAPPQQIGLSPLVLDSITSVLEQFVRDGHMAGAVAAVARNGRVGYFQAVGMRDVTRRLPMDEQTLFRIYSLSKPVTATAVMMLVEEGRLNLSDPVARHLPEFGSMKVRGEDGSLREASSPITVEDLLLHVSGLNHRTSQAYRSAGVRDRNDALPDFVRKITGEPLAENPRVRYRYSESPTVLGRLVEVVAGKPLDQFYQERIFGPLRMTQTSFWVEPEDRDRLAVVYRKGADGRFESVELEAVPFTTRPALLEGAVGLVSTVPDYLRFAQMLLNGGELDGVRVLRQETVRAMTANRLTPELLATRPDGTGWGLGNVRVILPTDTRAGASPGEFGWDGSAGTAFWVDPASGTVAVLMIQNSPADPESLRQRFRNLVGKAILN